MNRTSLFEFEYLSEAEGDLNPKLSQWMTACWAAELLVERHFPDLSSTDLVIDPGCGRGSWLKAIPQHVPAMGIEIDAVLAEQARVNTGREVITGDFLRVALPAEVTCLIGNPPYKAQTIKALLDRSRVALPENGRCGLLLPAYLFQLARGTAAMMQQWSMAAEMIPRDLFGKLKLPLVFVLFSKVYPRVWTGFALYEELADVFSMSKRTQLILHAGRPHRSAWRAVIEDAFEQCGSVLSLTQIYDYIQLRRPTGNRWWQERVREVLQRHFTQVERGVWSVA